MTTGTRQRRRNRDDRRATPQEMAAILDEYRTAEALRKAGKLRPVRPYCACHVHAKGLPGVEG
ncbi:hypothetical protein [Streptomyces sp. NPDC051567]|uniref:hypothetical protein n=1 Tax=Streptomyces sp. NPDC051567 TaxID=3365660 RepID=UPI0037A66465